MVPGLLSPLLSCHVFFLTLRWQLSSCLMAVEAALSVTNPLFQSHLFPCLIIWMPLALKASSGSSSSGINWKWVQITIENRVQCPHWVGQCVSTSTHHLMIGRSEKCAIRWFFHDGASGVYFNKLKWLPITLQSHLMGLPLYSAHVWSQTGCEVHKTILVPAAFWKELRHSAHLVFPGGTRWEDKEPSSPHSEETHLTFQPLTPD